MTEFEITWTEKVVHQAVITAETLDEAYDKLDNNEFYNLQDITSVALACPDREVVGTAILAV